MHYLLIRVSGKIILTSVLSRLTLFVALKVDARTKDMQLLLKIVALVFEQLLVPRVGSRVSKFLRSAGYIWTIMSGRIKSEVIYIRRRGIVLSKGVELAEERTKMVIRIAATDSLCCSNSSGRSVHMQNIVRTLD